jgi:DNA processing protein
VKNPASAGNPQTLQPDGRTVKTSPVLPYEELVDWVRLARTPGVGAKTFHQIIARFGTASEAIAHQAAWRGRGKDSEIVKPAIAEKEVAAATKAGLYYLPYTNPDYPNPLATLDDAPPLILVKGRREALAVPLLAIVGARNATINGRKFARQLAADLAKAGFGIISGLARGIDGAAHEGALSAGLTVAVLAGGADVLYPPEHCDLYGQIAEAGAIISEMPPGTEPQAALFPRRNRIISGASRAVVVVEATPRSGSLITARYAAEQGRDVFAVPGSPLDPRAHGPNALIRDGATLIQSSDNIIHEMQSMRVLSSNFSARPAPLSQEIEINSENDTATLRRKIEAALGPTPASVDELVRQCQVSPAVLATILLELELAGRLERLPGNRVALIGTV